jgi:hypothetical protein
MSAPEAGTTMAADGINFINEYDAGRVALGLFEQVAHPGGTDAHEHFNEFRTTDGEKGHPGLTGYSAGQKGLAGAGRADEENAARNTRSERLEALRPL